MDASAKAGVMASSYSVRCVTLSGTPQAGEGDADDAGEFSLNIDNSENSPIGCFVLEGTSIIASMSFESDEEGMSGDNSEEGTYTPSSGTTKLDFKTVTIDKDKGTAKVTKANVVAQNGGEAEVSGTWASMTGNWQLKSVAKVPEGYIGPCPVGTAEEDCDGPMENMVIHFAQYGALDGANKAHTGLALWESSSAKTACFGSGGGEGADLPAGWSAASGSGALTTSMNGLERLLPDPADVNVQSYGGNGTCDDNVATTCDQVVNGGTDEGTDPNDGWGSPAGGQFSDNQCKLMCVVNGAHDYYKSEDGPACAGRYEVDWDGFNTNLANTNTTPAYSGGWTGIDASTDGNDVTYFGNSVRFGNEPESRFMFGEVILNGNIGTLVDRRTWNFDVCTGTQGASNECDTKASCEFTESTRMTIVQSDASTATIELIMETKGAQANSSACVAKEDRRGSEKWFFKAVKQP